MDEKKEMDNPQRLILDPQKITPLRLQENKENQCHRERIDKNRKSRISSTKNV